MREPKSEQSSLRLALAVDAILDSGGIIEVAGISPPEDSYESEQLSLFNASRNDATLASNTNSESSTIPSETQHHFKIDALGHQLQIETVDSSLLTLNSNSSLPMAETTDEGLLGAFKQLLDAVIERARGVNIIPASGQILIAPLSVDTSAETELAIGSTILEEGLLRIGAAGELFVLVQISPISFSAFMT